MTGQGILCGRLTKSKKKSTLMVSPPVVARYTYDAWGVCTVTADTSGVNIATVNPFRYRSYYYDTETGLYYLQSHYYDPTVGRFVNADEAVIAVSNDHMFGHNLYTYCQNDPVKNKGTTGYVTIELAAAAEVLKILIYMSLLAVLVSLFFNPSFRNSFGRAITAFYQGIINGASYLINVITDVVERAKSRRRYSGYQVHHIVAQSDHRAYFTKKLLKKIILACRLGIIL